jgi:hypothetical protein
MLPEIGFLFAGLDCPNLTSALQTQLQFVADITRWRFWRQLIGWYVQMFTHKIMFFARITTGKVIARMVLLF